MAPEARLRATSVILAPTVNIQRVRSCAKITDLMTEQNLAVSSWRTCQFKIIPSSDQYSYVYQSFESFSEDPHLSGTIASAYINSIQNEGIACTIKHFVYGFSCDSDFLVCSQRAQLQRPGEQPSWVRLDCNSARPPRDLSHAFHGV